MPTTGGHNPPQTPPAPARRVFAATGTTDANGNVTFAFSPAFAAPPVVTHSLQTTVTDATEARITALAAGSVTFNVRRSPAVTLLGISVLQVPQPLAGATVHVHAVDAGPS